MFSVRFAFSTPPPIWRSPGGCCEIEQAVVGKSRLHWNRWKLDLTTTHAYLCTHRDSKIKTKLKTKLNRTKTKQSTAKQSKARQGKTRHDVT